MGKFKKKPSIRGRNVRKQGRSTKKTIPPQGERGGLGWREDLGQKEKKPESLGVKPGGKKRV